MVVEKKKVIGWAIFFAILFGLYVYHESIHIWRYTIGGGFEIRKDLPLELRTVNASLEGSLLKVTLEGYSWDRDLINAKPLVTLYQDSSCKLGFRQIIVGPFIANIEGLEEIKKGERFAIEFDVDLSQVDSSSEMGEKISKLLNKYKNNKGLSLALTVDEFTTSKTRPDRRYGYSNCINLP
ncbi:hypothetical protein H6501_03120 [Candidatus Woesearchaeota archaeon]|nr:hypothetical protein [Nanoarchaeota archaeon]MCB9370562.1 hypothetical protein [Candidatus Woesearchaeota archaeon]USN43645.1 MAG: hypothetical protein H6500_04605 [Candidatus Woesearchaeota archaeon]